MSLQLPKVPFSLHSSTENLLTKVTRMSLQLPQVPFSLHSSTENRPPGDLVAFAPEPISFSYRSALIFIRKKHLFGPGGEMLRYIQSEYRCQVDLGEEGRAYIFGTDAALVNEASVLVQDLVGEIKQGDTYIGEVLEMKDFGALVKLTRAQEAILHVSELTHDKVKIHLHSTCTPGRS